jgi:hypothetical protein
MGTFRGIDSERQGFSIAVKPVFYVNIPDQVNYECVMQWLVEGVASGEGQALMTSDDLLQQADDLDKSDIKDNPALEIIKSIAGLLRLCNFDGDIWIYAG